MNIITIIVCIVIVLYLFCCRKIQNANELSTTVTTIGVIGTFVGIVYGLCNFDVNNINESIPQLLEGLKTAFLTSIFGMIIGIWIKIRSKYLARKNDEEKSELSQIEIMINTLKSISDNQIELSQKENEQLKNIEKALCGEGDTTLLTQIQKMRLVFAEKQDELILEFQAFTETMAENNSKALIDALTQVMKDFNTKINEQFGENFKQLNKAVENILVWQENYKEHVEFLVEQLDEGVELLSKSEKSIASIEDNFEKIVTQSDELKKIISLFSNEIETIKEISESAKNAFPIIEENITKLTKDFSEKVKLATDELVNISKNQKDSSDKQIQFISDASNTLNEDITKVLRTLNTQIDSLMKQNAERIAKQVSELDKALQEELTKSLNSLASQLGSLSSKFTQDYTPITKNLKELLQSFNGDN